MNKIEELRAAFNAATGGEWRASQGCIYKGKTNISIAQCYVTTTNLNNDEVKNANFVALAHNNMPALLEAVEALEKMKTSFEDLLNGYPERELHEPYQVTLNRANNLLEKLN